VTIAGRQSSETQTLGLACDWRLTNRSASAAQINDYQRDEAALLLPGHQLTYATAPAYETTPGRSYEIV
jgi:hypothetical protein